MGRKSWFTLILIDAYSVFNVSLTKSKGPRLACLVGALMWSSAFFLAALAGCFFAIDLALLRCFFFYCLVHTHQFWLLLAGYGGVGGIGMGHIYNLY